MAYYKSVSTVSWFTLNALLHVEFDHQSFYSHKLKWIFIYYFSGFTNTGFSYWLLLSNQSHRTYIPIKIAYVSFLYEYQHFLSFSSHIFFSSLSSMWHMLYLEYKIKLNVGRQTITIARRRHFYLQTFELIYHS